MLKTKQKEKIIKEYQDHKEDTGSASVQVAILTEEIERLALHLKKHPKDKHSRRGLLGMVNKRRKLLHYLSEEAPISYKKIIKKLGLKR